VSQSASDAFAWVDADPGIRRRILQVGDASMLMTVVFQPNATAAVHVHPHEQITYVAKGELTMTVDGVRHVLRQGDSILLKGGVPHGASASVETVLLDSFTPPRQDLIERDRGR
jgi:quercetin dioxygenase-like cupin family protein